MKCAEGCLSAAGSAAPVCRVRPAAVARGENQDNINILRMSHARCHVQTTHNTGHTTQRRQKATILSILTMSVCFVIGDVFKGRHNSFINLIKTSHQSDFCSTECVLGIFRS